MDDIAKRAAATNDKGDKRFRSKITKEAQAALSGARRDVQSGERTALVLSTSLIDAVGRVV